MADYERDRGSFRDREARVFHRDGQIFRALSSRALEQWRRVSATRFFSRLVDEGKIVSTDELAEEAPTGWQALLAHERIPFISYPYEWSFGMLRDAALLHLEILDACLAEGFVLKDSTPYNIQWVGARPKFIDITSIESLEPGEPWRGYRQFCEMFLNPLLLQAYKGIAFQPLMRGRIDGISVHECRRTMSLRDLARKGVFTHVYLHSKIQREGADIGVDVRTVQRHGGVSKEMIRSNVCGLRKTIQDLRWTDHPSSWSMYEQSHSYDAADRTWKEEFVSHAVEQSRREVVWDLGCNVGVFSRIAARSAGIVLAIDGDHQSVDRLYTSLKMEGCPNILPLVMNLADPSPNQGFDGKERRSLPERGTPDLVLALALIHHLVIGANIPLSDVLDWIASLESDLVIEFVTREDPMVMQLLRNKRDNYEDYDETRFERELETRWRLVKKERSGSGTRVMYHGVRS